MAQRTSTGNPGSGKRGGRDRNAAIVDHMKALGIDEADIVTDIPDVGSLFGGMHSPFGWIGPPELIDPSKGRLVRVVSERTEQRLHSQGFRRVNDERIQMRGVKGGFVMFQPKPLADEARRQREAGDRSRSTGEIQSSDQLNAGGITATGTTRSKWSPATVTADDKGAS